MFFQETTDFKLCKFFKPKYLILIFAEENVVFEKNRYHGSAHF
jgi:hypothetical protein